MRTALYRLSRNFRGIRVAALSALLALSTVATAIAASGSFEARQVDEGTSAWPIGVWQTTVGGDVDIVLATSTGVARGRVSVTGAPISPLPWPVTPIASFAADSAISDGGGGLLLAGRDASTRLKVAHVLADGSLDPGFGTGGYAVITQVAPTGGLLLARGADGRIIVAEALGDRDRTTALVALTPGGSVDQTFGVGGQAPYPGDDHSVYGGPITIDAAGRIIVASSNAASSQIRLVRLTSGGTLDPDFGSGGLATAITDTQELLEPTIAADSAGRVVVGARRYDQNTATSSGVLARVDVHGVPDAAFGAAGRTASLLPRVVGIDGDGRVLLASQSGADDAASRMTAAGTIDCGYGSQGLAGPAATAVAGVPFKTTTIVGADGTFLSIAGTPSAQGIVSITRFDGGGISTDCRPAPQPQTPPQAMPVAPSVGAATPTARPLRHRALSVGFPAEIRRAGRTLNVRLSCDLPAGVATPTQTACRGTITIRAYGTTFRRPYRVGRGHTATLAVRVPLARWHAAHRNEHARVTLTQHAPVRIHSRLVPIHAIVR